MRGLDQSLVHSRCSIPSGLSRCCQEGMDIRAASVSGEVCQVEGGGMGHSWQPMPRLQGGKCREW